MSGDTPSSYRNVGFFQHVGLEMTHSEAGRVTGRLDVGAQHLNRAGFVHGGVLCTLIDFAACAAGLHSRPGEPQRYAVTIALTTNFTKAASQGILTVEGKIITAATRTYTAEARVMDSAGDPVAHGIGTFQWQRASAPSATQHFSGTDNLDV